MNATSRAARNAGSLDHLELSLVEFCQLVDFLLDIVSLVSSFCLSVCLSLFLSSLSVFHLLFLTLLLFHCKVLSLLNYSISFINSIRSHS